jgi:hypothetical protein
MSEKKFLFGENTLFDDVETLIPDVLDAAGENKKPYYVKINCKTKNEVVEIIKVFEKLNIERKRIVISA